MSLIYKVVQVSAHILQLPGGTPKLEIAALGEVTSSGWTNPRLSPVFYVSPPPDGIWDFEFQADPPHGISGQVILPVGAIYAGVTPDWCKGVRVHAASNAIEAEAKSLQPAEKAPPSPIRAAARGLVIVQQSLATYDDSFQPTGTIHWKNDGPFGLPTPHVEMKKLRHELTLTIEGPNEDQIRNCIRQAAVAGVIAAIVAAVATGGGALHAAISAALAALEQCLGDGFSVRIDDQSHWIFWDT
ncbi:hypothetical protein [Caulobacter sp. BP25]|uniref:hypothetical protein n=1 Tax=Caulobacter sp. BP25 TaxID=2048900 RepID=UPI00191BBACF|nr:hypothetical protein [Caulobacter sp. BP25]